MDCNTSYASCDFQLSTHLTRPKKKKKIVEEKAKHFSPTRHPKFMLVCPRVYKISEGKGESSTQMLSQESWGEHSHQLSILSGLFQEKKCFPLPTQRLEFSDTQSSEVSVGSRHSRWNSSSLHARNPSILAPSPHARTC